MPLLSGAAGNDSNEVIVIDDDSSDGECAGEPVPSGRSSPEDVRQGSDPAEGGAAGNQPQRRSERAAPSSDDEGEAEGAISETAGHSGGTSSHGGSVEARTPQQMKEDDSDLEQEFYIEKAQAVSREEDSGEELRRSPRCGSRGATRRPSPPADTDVAGRDMHGQRNGAGSSGSGKRRSPPQPPQGPNYVGRRIRKLFDEGPFEGVVDEYLPEESWYHVTYDDGDDEDLFPEDVERWLLPEDEPGPTPEPQRRKKRKSKAAPPAAEATARGAGSAERRICDDIATGLEGVRIPVYNGVDDDDTLPSFRYCTRVEVQGSVAGLVRKAAQDPLRLALPDGKPPVPAGRAYWDDGRLHRMDCHGIDETDAEERHKVVSRGLTLPLELFKAGAHKGWGVRCAKDIPAGTFICEYAGELIDEKEAEARFGKDEYLYLLGHFELFADQEIGNGSHLEHAERCLAKVFAPPTIDALAVGNVGRFINHSDRPNVEVVPVFTDPDHSTLYYRHCFFAGSKDIPAGTELVYNYQYDRCGRIPEWLSKERAARQAARRKGKAPAVGRQNEYRDLMKFCGCPTPAPLEEYRQVRYDKRDNKWRAVLRKRDFPESFDLRWFGNASSVAFGCSYAEAFQAAHAADIAAQLLGLTNVITLNFKPQVYDGVLRKGSQAAPSRAGGCCDMAELVDKVRGYLKSNGLKEAAQPAPSVPSATMKRCGCDMAAQQPGQQKLFRHVHYEKQTDKWKAALSKHCVTGRYPSKEGRYFYFGSAHSVAAQAAHAVDIAVLLLGMDASLLNFKPHVYKAYLHPDAPGTSAQSAGHACCDMMELVGKVRGHLERYGLQQPNLPLPDGNAAGLQPGAAHPGASSDPENRRTKRLRRHTAAAPSIPGSPDLDAASDGIPDPSTPEGTLAGLAPPRSSTETDLPGLDDDQAPAPSPWSLLSFPPADLSATRPAQPAPGRVSVAFVPAQPQAAAAAVASLAQSAGGLPVGLVLADARPGWQRAEFASSIAVAQQVNGEQLGPARWAWFLDHTQLPGALAACTEFGLETRLLTWVQPPPRSADGGGREPDTVQLLVGWQPAPGGSLFAPGRECAGALRFERVPEVRRAGGSDGPPVDPWEKPVKLVARLLDMLADRGALVVDLTCGCGTTAVAAGSLWCGDGTPDDRELPAAASSAGEPSTGAPHVVLADSCPVNLEAARQRLARLDAHT